MRTRVAFQLPLGSLLALVLLGGCAKEKLFQSNFDAMPSNQPPAPAQQVGTVAIDGPADGVHVVDPPVTPSGKWVKISRPTTDTGLPSMQCNLSASRGDGKYTFSTTVLMPTGSGVATIQFERFGQPVTDVDAFLHLDLMPDNRVRIDDNDGTLFGTFPRDQPFIVQVTLNINASSPSAAIALGGAGASGTANHNIQAAFIPQARQFGAARLRIGFPHTGSLSATNIAVSRE